jgi:hypothetical protein
MHSTAASATASSARTAAAVALYWLFLSRALCAYIPDIPCVCLPVRVLMIFVVCCSVAGICVVEAVAQAELNDNEAHK